ncbi:MAG TPA: Maf family protein [Terriglobales bacterium]|nr:Maf family protein [Terriglobales bacterium]
MLILASSSPRRAELLRNARIEFRVCPPEVVEELHPGELPIHFARRMAEAKAHWVFAREQGATVLGADTIVTVGDCVLGKPRDQDDAMQMLRQLSGRTHQVTTGICLIGGDTELLEDETTEVVMSEISEDEIRAYVATGEPMDKAGAYAIQGMASRWVSRIDGDYCNVVGLPVARVWGLMRELALR